MFPKSRKFCLAPSISLYFWKVHITCRICQFILSETTHSISIHPCFLDLPNDIHTYLKGKDNKLYPWSRRLWTDKGAEPTLRFVWLQHTLVSRSRWPQCLWRTSAVACFLGLRVRIPPPAHVYFLWPLCVVQLEASATGRSIILVIPTKCACVTLCDLLYK
jgi:hypothetical protein